MLRFLAAAKVYNMCLYIYTYMFQCKARIFVLVAESPSLACDPKVYPRAVGCQVFASGLDSDVS